MRLKPGDCVETHRALFGESDNPLNCFGRIVSIYKSSEDYLVMFASEKSTVRLDGELMKITEQDYNERMDRHRALEVIANG